MGRAERKKNDFKKKAKEIYDEHYYFVISGFGFVIMAVILSVFGLYQHAMNNRFDVNTIESLENVDYHADYYKEISEPYVVVEGEDIEDTHLVKIQSEIVANDGIEVPVYLVSDSEEFNEDFTFYEPHLLKASEVVDTKKYEVTSFNEYYLEEYNGVSVTEWDIEDGSFDGDTYIVSGWIDDKATNQDKLSQLGSLSDMIKDLNKENEELDEDMILLDFVDGEDNIRYHSKHKNVIGKVATYTNQSKEE